MNRKPVTTLLLVEDNPGDARLLHETLRRQDASHIDLVHVQSMGEAERYLSAHAVDIVLLDLGLPDAQGLQAVLRAHAAAPRVPLVVLTGLEDESLARQALQEGAQDHLIKGEVDGRGLLRALGYAIERKTMEDALFEEKERAQVTLNCIADAVACTDNLGNISFLNVVAESMTGWSLQEAVGRPMAEVLRMWDATDRESVDLASPALLPEKCNLVRRDGKQIPIENSVAPIRNREGHATGAVIVFRDVSAARATALQMTHAAEHDFLTGLPNRTLLNDRIGQAIALASRHNKRVAVLFLDLDGFKHVNDSLGHLIGDKLLQSVANRLVACVRSVDTVSRLGGDEFVVVLSELERSEDVAITARKLLKVVATAHSIDQQTLHTSTSIGVSVYPGDGRDAETLIKNADTAMYQAKERGRQRYQFFAPAMNVRAVQRQLIEEGLPSALERGEFFLNYLPKINLRTGEITGAQALIRWTHPVQGHVPLAQFIPVAEDGGYMFPIGNWVLREACRQAQAWADAGLGQVEMAVNICAAEFRADHFLDSVVAVLQETGFDPRFLELELTERVLMKNAATTELILKKLRDKGVRVVVDDFGTGASSLSFIRQFPVDTLKIDRSFVQQISPEGDPTRMVATVIGMGHSLDLRVIAEGVETREGLVFLQAHQCDEAQGYYFSEPLSAQEFAELLKVGLAETAEARA
ncbi:MAG TPA: EAL domain-containing protein [Burkholderiaceae bacterium]|nr:EAL domain-containing protein [Burkholderiaceae bacterium]